MTVSLTKAQISAPASFYGLWNADVRYPAVGFGRTWNGWATPIVPREVLAQLIADAPGHRVWFHPESGVARIDTDQETGSWQHYASIAPELRGNVQAYPLESLGWTFLEDESRRAAEEEAAWAAMPTHGTYSSA